MFFPISIRVTIYPLKQIKRKDHVLVIKLNYQSWNGIAQFVKYNKKTSFCLSWWSIYRLCCKCKRQLEMIWLNMLVISSNPYHLCVYVNIVFARDVWVMKWNKFFKQMINSVHVYTWQNTDHYATEALQINVWFQILLNWFYRVLMSWKRNVFSFLFSVDK